MYAVLKTGGKQYRVAEKQILAIEKIEGDAGHLHHFEEVLMIEEESNALLGYPIIPGAKIIASILAQKRDEKIIVFKKKRRQNYRRKNGHRQEITLIHIEQIARPGDKITVTSPTRILRKEEETQAQVGEKTIASPKETSAPQKATASTVRKEEDKKTTKTASTPSLKQGEKAPKNKEASKGKNIQTKTSSPTKNSVKGKASNKSTPSKAAHKKKIEAKRPHQLNRDKS